MTHYMVYFAFVQAIISSFVFIFRKPKHISNSILALYFMFQMIYYIGDIVPGGIKQYTFIGNVPFLFLYGPVIYFYVLSLIKERLQFKYKHLLHLIPFVLLSIARVTYWKEPISLEDSFGMGFNSANVFMTIPFFIYIIAIFSLVLKHKKNIENHFSSISNNLTLNWVIYSLIAVFVSMLICVSIPIFKSEFNSGKEMIFWFFHFNLGILGFLILIFGLQQPILFSENQQELNEKETSNRYSKSSLSKETLTNYSSTINNYLKSSKPYLNPEYSLDMLSKEVEISKQAISQTINLIDQRNFYQLINELRVNEIIQMLSMPKYKAYTLLAVAFEAGFNSKASFNRVFKEITGTTPSAFKSNLNNT